MKINFAAKTIEVTKTFARKASNYGTQEYKQLSNVMTELPNFQIVVKAASITRRTYTKGLTYEYMAHYISECDEDGSLMRDFQILRQGCSYGEIKKWFMTVLPEFNNFAA
jgi:hypothetical protein